MDPVLTPYDPTKEVVQFPQYREKENPERSLVQLSETDERVRIEIKPGSLDQQTADTIFLTWNNAWRWELGRILSTKNEAYGKICDLVLKLKQPEVYRKKDLLSKEGYSVEQSQIERIIAAAKEGRVGSMLLQTTSAYIKGMIYYAVNIYFNKEKEEKN